MRQFIKSEGTACFLSLEITRCATVDDPQPDGPTKTASEPPATVVTSLSSVVDRDGLIISPITFVMGRLPLAI